VQGGGTLVDFLVEALAAHTPHLLAVPDELSAVLAAERLDYDYFKLEIERLARATEAVVAELQYAKLRARAGARVHLSVTVAEGGRVSALTYTDSFERKMEPFCEEAAEAVRVLQVAHAELVGAVPEVIVYFGESPESCSLNELIQGTARFVKELLRAREQLAERKAKGSTLLVPLPAQPEGGAAAGEGSSLGLELRRRASQLQAESS
jgi:hypothetical protein